MTDNSSQKTAIFMWLGGHESRCFYDVCEEQDTFSGGDFFLYGPSATVCAYQITDAQAQSLMEARADLRHSFNEAIKVTPTHYALARYVKGPEVR